MRYLERDFRVRKDTSPIVLACGYCEREVEARLVGDLDDRRCFRHTAPEVAAIAAGRRAYFETEDQAQAAGFALPNS